MEKKKRTCFLLHITDSSALKKKTVILRFSVRSVRQSPKLNNKIDSQIRKTLRVNSFNVNSKKKQLMKKT